MRLPLCSPQTSKHSILKNSNFLLLWTAVLDAQTSFYKGAAEAYGSTQSRWTQLAVSGDRIAPEPVDYKKVLAERRGEPYQVRVTDPATARLCANLFLLVVLRPANRVRKARRIRARAKWGLAEARCAAAVVRAVARERWARSGAAVRRQ